MKKTRDFPKSLSICDFYFVLVAGVVKRKREREREKEEERTYNFHFCLYQRYDPRKGESMVEWTKKRLWGIGCLGECWLRSCVLEVGG